MGSTLSFGGRSDVLADQLAQLHVLLPVLSKQAHEAQEICAEAARALARAGRSEHEVNHRADVCMIIRARAIRGTIMPADWFGDPAWDLLLRLYEAHLDRVELTMGDLIERTGIKPTTAGRWLDVIGGRGWVRRRPCAQDNRRVYAELTEQGAATMAACFEAMRG